MMVMLVITSLAYDERSRWDRYALTMPVSRKEMVLSKYLLGLILLTFALLINMIFLILFGSSPLGEAWLLALSLFGIGLILAVHSPPSDVQIRCGKRTIIIDPGAVCTHRGCPGDFQDGAGTARGSLYPGSAHLHPGYNGPGCAPIHPGFAANLSAQRNVTGWARHDL